MQEVSPETDTGETEFLRRREEREPVVADQGNVDRHFQMSGLRRAANLCVPSFASMTGIDEQGAPDPSAQCLQRIQKF